MSGLHDPYAQLSVSGYIVPPPGAIGILHIVHAGCRVARRARHRARAVRPSCPAQAHLRNSPNQGVQISDLWTGHANAAGSTRGGSRPPTGVPRGGSPTRPAGLPRRPPGRLRRHPQLGKLHARVRGAAPRADLADGAPGPVQLFSPTCAFGRLGDGSLSFPRRQRRLRHFGTPWVTPCQLGFLRAELTQRTARRPAAVAGALESVPKPPKSRIPSRKLRRGAAGSRGRGAVGRASRVAGARGCGIAGSREPGAAGSRAVGRVPRGRGARGRGSRRAVGTASPR